MKVIELYALRLQDWFLREYSELIAVQEIEMAMKTKCGFEDPISPLPISLTTDGYRAVMQQGAKLNGEVKAGEDKE